MLVVIFRSQRKKQMCIFVGIVFIEINGFFNLHERYGGFENGKDLKKDWEQEADIFVKTARTESEKNGESADETA